VSLGVGRQITLQFGDAVIHGLAGNSDRAAASGCRFDIDRDAVRIANKRSARPVPTQTANSGQTDRFAPTSSALAISNFSRSAAHGCGLLAGAASEFDPTGVHIDRVERR
jgi:hypothetical protein